MNRRKKMSYEGTLAEAILQELWTSHVSLTTEEIGHRLSQPTKNISATMSNLKRVPLIRENLSWDQTTKPWSYTLAHNVPLPELFASLRKSERAKKIVKGATAKLSTPIQEIYAGPFIFPKGFAIRVTGDFHFEKIGSVSVDAIFEIVEGGELKRVEK